MQAVDLVVERRAVLEVEAQRRALEHLDVAVLHRHPVHPDAAVDVDAVDRVGPGDHVDLVSLGGQTASGVRGEPSHAPDRGRVLAGHEAVPAGVLTAEHRERPEVALGCGDLDGASLGGEAELDAFGDPPVHLLDVGIDPLGPTDPGQLATARADDPVGPLAQLQQDLAARPVRAAVRQCEVVAVLDDRIRMRPGRAVRPEVARQVVVVHRSAVEGGQAVTPVDQLHAHLDLVEVVLDRLVEAADLGERVAAEAAVGALQVHEGVGARIHVLVEGTDEVEAGVADAGARRVAVLQLDAAVVPDEPAGAGDPGVVVGGGQPADPVRFGHGVVVDEGHDVPGGGTYAGVARAAEVDLGQVDDPDAVGPLLEQLRRAVGRRAVDHDDLEVAPDLTGQSVERGGQAGGSVGGVDDDADAWRGHALPSLRPSATAVFQVPARSTKPTPMGRAPRRTASGWER